MKIAKPAHYFKKMKDVFVLIKGSIGCFFTKKIHKYTYQVREKDPETGKEVFQLRFRDARIGRWLTADLAGQYASLYFGMGNGWSRK